jgi:hypothetical protein
MINSVRNTVLSVLNKNNYGYISPSDFNLYAKQAQMELYEEYYSNYNKTINFENQRGAGTDYASIEKPIAEVLETFLEYEFLWPVLSSAGTLTNKFFAPSVTTTGDSAYMLSKIIYYNQLKAQGANTLVVPFQLEDAGALFINDGVIAGDIVTNNVNFLSATVLAVIGQTQLLLDTDIFTATPVTYSIFSSTNLSEAERVTDGKITMLTMSPLTAPSTMFPAYTLTDSYVNTYPAKTSGYGTVAASYFRYPKEPKWTYITLVNGEPAFDQTQPDYQDFELPLEDEYKLAMKILQYCGISIREYQVTQYAMGQEQHEQPTFSQQQ